MGPRVVPMEWRERIGLEYPVVQAGMAAAAGPALAGAVSAAGGLGTVGIMAPQAFAASLRMARGLAPGRPVAGNLIVPFTRRAHVDACVSEGAALVVLHGGFAPRWVRRLRAGGVPVFQTVGTAAQARRALSEGATGLVVQGLEAGGHLVGVEPLERALPQVLDVAGRASRVPPPPRGGRPHAGNRAVRLRLAAAPPGGAECGDRALVPRRFGPWSAVGPSGGAAERRCRAGDATGRFGRRGGAPAAGDPAVQPGSPAEGHARGRGGPHRPLRR